MPTSPRAASFVDNGGSTDITTLRRIGNKGLQHDRQRRVPHQVLRPKSYGYNAFGARHAELMELPPTQYFARSGHGSEIETVINVRLATAGIKITEVGSFEGPRLHGRSNLNAWQ